VRVAAFTFRCSECGKRYNEDEVRYLCPECAPRREPGGALRGVLEVVLDDGPLRFARPYDSAETLARCLPVASAGSLPPLPVGATPLLPVPQLRRELDMPHLWVKDDTRNPSGSTKDRASALVVAKAAEYGYHTVACASTGNAATALACLAAAAGLRAVVFVPVSAPPAKLAQIAAYGATLIPVDGSYDDAFELSIGACERFGWYNRNTAYSPFTIEGKKTLGLEIGAALRPEGADVVVVPVGDGVIVSGLARGLREVAARPPRLVAVQPRGADAIVRALREGRARAASLTGARSVADSLVVAAPRNAAMALREVRASGGGGISVSDDAILAAIALLARTTGVFAEPAAAAPLAGLLAALDEGVVDRGERVVLVVTGSGLKDLAAAARAVEIPEPIPCDLGAVAERLARGSAGGAPRRDSGVAE
jgi:threonine synthase